MLRKPAIVGNWKMELSHKGALEVVRALKKLLKGVNIVSDVVICPSFSSLSEVAAAVKNSDKIQVGAQNVHWEDRGAFTGQVAAMQLTSFVDWCIIGHSEQRALTGETDEQVQLKANLLLKHGITPVVCLGETAEERQADQTVSKVTQQVRVLLASITRTALAKMVLVYEPVWAISAQGSGHMPEPSEVAEIVLLIRKIAAGKFGNEAAERLRILYGGSIKPDNIERYVAEPGVDGGLVGGASIHPLQFLEIVKKVQMAIGEE